MTDTYHPLVVRFAAARAMFQPELTDAEIVQMQDIAVENLDMTELDLNRKFVTEFGLEVRNQARINSEDNIDQMTQDFKDLIVKWGILKMVDPLVVAGSVINHLNGMSAVIGCFIEDKMRAIKPAPTSEEQD